MNILSSVFISALAGVLFVYGSLLTEVESETAIFPQIVATNSGNLFGVDTFYGRGLHPSRRIREIVASPYCR